MAINAAKWKKAVVHLECATSSTLEPGAEQELEEARQELEEDYAQALASGELSQEEHDEEYNLELSNLRLGINRDVRSTGTALFVLYKTKYYLITARHVVWDKSFASYYLKKRNDAINRENITLENAELLDDFGYNNAIHAIFHMIFSVKTIAETGQDNTLSNFLMNLGAGGRFDNPNYTFSSIDNDLAVISLQQENGFLEGLMQRGYEPISIEDIALGPDYEGQDVFTVGYPIATAHIKENTKADSWGTGVALSVPVFAFGKVAMCNQNLNYFWTDISAYPGNSGGPMVADDKLVGIIGSQAIDIFEQKDTTDKIEYPIPFAKIIKSEFVLDLLEEHENKEVILYMNGIKRQGEMQNRWEEYERNRLFSK